MKMINLSIQERGFSLLEMFVAGVVGVIIVIALATALDVAWIYYLEVTRYERVDNIISMAERFIKSKVINSKGGWYWMSAGTRDLFYFYSNQGADSIILEGKEINNSGVWVRVEDANLFSYALLEGYKYVDVTSSDGIKGATILQVDSELGTIKIKSINDNSFWINRGDVIEISKELAYLEIRDEKLWTEKEKYISDGIVGIDILYTIGGRSGYGIVQLDNPETSKIICLYDANGDGQLTIEDDINGDGILDCIEVEPIEQTKFDGIQYWILGKLPENEASKRESPFETFVVGRKIYNVSRAFYPRIIIRKLNFDKFEL